MSGKSIIWILVDKKANFNSQLKLAQSLDKENEIFFLITCFKKVELLDFNGAKKTNFFKESNQDPNNSKTSFLKILAKIIFHNSPIGIIFYSFFLINNKLKIQKLILDQVPKLILLNSDRSGPSFETIILILAKKFRIKIVLPYLSIINSGQLVRVKNPVAFKLNIIGKKLINSKYKFQKDKSTYGFYSLSQYFTLKLFNCITENPFSIGNHPTTTILCLDSNHTLNQVSKNILRHEKIRYVGRNEFDYFSENLEKKKKNILLSLPHLYEHKILNWETHIKFINQLLKTLCGNQKVIISLHPKSNYKNYKFLEKKFKCLITKKPIHEELIHAKLFVCVNSSVAIWSTLLGVKTIILNFFDLDMSMFSNLESITYVDSMELLSTELKNNEVIDYSKDWETLKRKYLFSQSSESKMNQMLQTILS